MSLRFQFTMIDRNSVSHSIDEPIGWDAEQLSLTRDPDKHGVWFDYGNDDFVYQRTGARLLRAEYEAYGAQGNMSLLIEESCNDVFETLYTGKFVFTQYYRVAGTECDVKCPVEATGDVMSFKNRMDQAVTVQPSMVAFDSVTYLNYLPTLNPRITLPGKSILVEDYATVAAAHTQNFQDTEYVYQPSSGTPYLQTAVYIPPFELANSVNEIGGFDVSDAAPSDLDQTYEINAHNYPSGTLADAGWNALPYTLNNAGSSPFAQAVPIDAGLIAPIVNYDATLGNTFDNTPITATLSIDVDAVITPAGPIGPISSPTYVSGRLIRNWAYFCCKVDDANNYIWYSNTASGWYAYSYPSASSGYGFPVGFHITQTLTVTINPGDRLFFFSIVQFITGSSNLNAANMSPAFSVTTNVGSYFRLRGLSKEPDTDCSVFLINETISRVTEAITNDKLRMYSDYFGRTDSLPYSRSTDGEGSRACLTTGKFIRRLEQIRPAQLPQLNISINDLWAGLNPLHNLGMGIEPDTLRPGYNRLRVEQWAFFYQDTVVFSCYDVQEITIESQEKEYYSTFKFGYQKWEASAFNGIDEFLTDRTYRTDLDSVRNTLTQISTFVLSGFALEVTRRKGNSDSSDDNYDEEVFMIALTRSGSALVVEQGGIVSTANIIDPDTIYNFRHTPLRMAMKWLPAILASYRQAGYASKITFTDGSGNYYATGAQTTSFYPADAGPGGPIAENQVLTPANMRAPANGLPILRPERVKFDYPMTMAEYKLIKANPNGLIHFETDGLVGDGWIDSFVYTPVSGTGSFTLIPKIES